MISMFSKKELIILNELRKDGRKSLTELSQETKIPISTVLTIVKRLEKNVIQRYISLLNFSKLGYNIRVNLFLKLKEIQKEAGKDFILSHPNINSLYGVNGHYDYFLEGIFKNMGDFGKFKEELETLSLEVKEHHIIEDVKIEGFVI